jgi:hypothetical protein
LDSRSCEHLSSHIDRYTFTDETFCEFSEDIFFLRR